MTYDDCTEQNANIDISSNKPAKSNPNSGIETSKAFVEREKHVSTKKTVVKIKTTPENVGMLKDQFGDVSIIFENSFIPSLTKFDNPNNGWLAGDCRCCVAARSERSTDDEIPELESKIKTRRVKCVRLQI